MELQKNTNSGFAKVDNIDKEFILVYRELGYKTLLIKGFDTMKELRDFMASNSEEYIFMERLERGK